MYFVRYKALKKKLADRTLSDREALPYLLIYTGGIALVTSIPSSDGFNKWDGILAFLSVATTLAGIFYAYKQNGGNEGYDLIQKYTVLGWVVGVRFFLCFIPAMIIFLTLKEHLGIAFFEGTGPYDVIFIFFTEVILNQRIGRHIRDTKMANKSEPNVQHELA